jgi:ATP-dependent DNA helicase RecG
MSGKMSEKKMERAISLLRQNKDMTTSVLAEQLGVSTRTAERYIKRLKETGRLRRKGPDKGGCWEVIK